MICLAAVTLDRLALELKLENNFPYGVVKIDSTLIPYLHIRMQCRSALHRTHPTPTLKLPTYTTHLCYLPLKQAEYQNICIDNMGIRSLVPECVFDIVIREGIKLRVSSGLTCCNVYPFSIEFINCGPVFIYGPYAKKYKNKDASSGRGNRRKSLSS
jgi:hypothetical protein